MDDFSNFLDELKQRASIADVVSSYVPLQRRGGSGYWACCPLHVEKTASFKIDEARNTYHCFGCHESGDVITFIEKMEKTDFMGAVEFLARKYNMEVPKKNKDKNFSENRKKRERLYDLTREAALYYTKNLNSPAGAKAREYLASRGLSTKTITKFGLGYSINSSGLINHLKSKGFTEDEMQEARVGYISNGRCYDPQHERFVTPIINSTKNVIAFGGRIIEKKDPNTAKYYNSMESFIFHKSKELFGQHILKELRNVDCAVLVEGYMDVIALYQAGIENAVASMGTALTEEQARLLKRFVKKVYFMYDGDAAGQKGMLRGVDILKNAGLDVQCVVLENDLDPDEYIKKFGAEAMKDKIYNKSIPMYQYKINSIAKEHNLKNAEGRGKFAAEAIELIKDIPYESQVEPMLQFIEEKSFITSSYLLEQFKKVRQGIKITNKTFALADTTSSKQLKAFRFILFAAYGGVEGVKVKDEYLECIQNEQQIEIYNRFRQEENVKMEDLEEMRENNEEVEKIIAEGNSIQPKVAQKYFNDCRVSLLKTLYEEKKKQILLDIQNETDNTVKQLLLTQLVKIDQDIKSVK